jgi:hypothetical protein
MLEKDVMKAVASQMMNGDSVAVGEKSFHVRRTSAQHLKTVTFIANGAEYTAIEQNPDKPSRWGQLARDGHQVVQFKDDASNRFIAVVVDNEVKTYGEQG